VGREARQYVMRILPHGLGHDQRRLWIDAFEDLDAFALRGNEAVAQLFLIGMRPHNVAAGRRNRRSKLLFHLLLCRPAHLIRASSQVATGNQRDRVIRSCHG